MNLTLHLTEACNMDCAYCTRVKQPVRMTEAVLDAACDLAFSQGKTAGLCFFGGEPLLERPLIERAVARCKQISAETGKPVSYKMTTNGTLLDADFLSLAKREDIGIGLSFEGTAQDCCRTFRDGSGSFSVVSEKAKLLLDYQPDAEAVRYLYDLGFRRITGTIAYGKKVHWTDSDLELLEAQLREIAAYYAERFLHGRPFYFSPFDAKIRDCITGFNPGERCHLGFRQMPVAPDGRIYARTQFIRDADFCLGDVFGGISKERQRELAKREAVPETCRECALRKRCTNSCGCLNRLETGNENTVSPLQCTYEQMLIAIADETADRLFTADEAAFRRRYAQG